MAVRGDKWFGRVQRRDSGQMMNVDVKGGRPQRRFLDVTEKMETDKRPSSESTLQENKLKQ